MRAASDSRLDRRELALRRRAWSSVYSACLSGGMLVPPAIPAEKPSAANTGSVGTAGTKGAGAGAAVADRSQRDLRLGAASPLAVGSLCHRDGRFLPLSSWAAGALAEAAGLPASTHRMYSFLLCFHPPQFNKSRANIGYSP